jgi:hypothetical protein
MPAELKIVITGANESGSAFQSVKTELSDIGAASDQAKEKGSGFFSGMLASAGGFLAANVIGSISSQFSSFITGGIADAREANQLMSQTEAVITSTGGAAGVTAQHIADVATALSASAGTSLFGDDQVQQSENLLLTFTNIKGAVLDSATSISVDMAQALGGAPKDSAIQLGKALNDPVKGISALSRVGVTFTDQQKDMIKTMVAAGDTAGAQNVILGELSHEFGGSAAAAAKADGGMAQLKDQMGELGESVGGILLPILNKGASILANTVMPAVTGLVDAFKTGAGDTGDFVGGLSNMLYSLDTISPLFDTMGDAVIAFADSFGSIVEAFTDVGPLSDEFAESIGGLAQAFGLPVAAVDILEGAIFAVQDAFIAVTTGAGQSEGAFAGLVTVVNGLQSVFTQLQSIVGAAFTAIVQAITTTGPQVAEQMQANFGTAVTAAMGVFNGIVAVVQSVLGVVLLFIQQHGAQLVSSFMTTYTSIQTTVATVLGLVGSIVSGLLGQVAIFIQNHGTEISNFMMTAWTQIQGIIQTTIAIINATIVPALTVIANYIRTHGTQIQAILTTVWTVISTIIKATLATIQGILTIALDLIKGDWTGAWVALQGIVTTQLDAMKTIVSSILGAIQTVFSGAGASIKSGWSSAMSSLSSVTSGAMNGAVSAVKSGINSVIDTINGFIRGYNDIASTVGGPHIGTIGHLAKGASSLGQAGTYLVGERGPERVYLPKGARVDTAASTAQAQGGGGDVYHMNFPASNTGMSRADTEKLFKQMLAATGRTGDIRTRTS